MEEEEEEEGGKEDEEVDEEEEVDDGFPVLTKDVHSSIMIRLSRISDSECSITLFFLR